MSAIAHNGRRVPLRARAADGPTGIQGQVNIPGVLPWAALTWVDTSEHVPDLIWPMSIKTFNRMRTDSQVNGLYLGCTLPIRRYKWAIKPNGAKAKIVEALAEDFNLPIQGEDDKPSGRMKDRFSWDEFLRTALLALAYGHRWFEIEGMMKDGIWRLKNLWDRPPDTVVKVDVARDGTLVSIKQALGIDSPEIPATRIVPFVWDKEGGNWFGRSLFRAMYRNWLIKDRLLRVDAMKHERNGLGVPNIEAPQGASKRQLDALNALAQAYRAGDTAGMALPAGAKLNLTGTTGTLPDTVASINMHDEAMARSMLLMFMQLGSTLHGSRALGDSFLDYFNMAQETIAIWIEDVLSQYLIEDWVTWNYDEDEPCPRIGHEPNADPTLAIADLALLIQNKAITVDPDLEAYIRARYMLPPPPDESEEPETPEPPAAPALPSPVQSPGALPAPGETPAAAAPTAGPVTASGRRKCTVAAAEGTASLLPLPNRTLRRQPYEQEVRASVDYAQMDEDYTAAKSSLVSDVRQQQSKQIDQIKELIIAAKGDVKKLAAIQADPIHADTVLARLIQMATTGAYQAINEAKRQGVTIAMPDMGKVTKSLEARATATDSLLARSISEAAGRKALALTGPKSATPEKVAGQVHDYLSGLSTSYLEDQLGGALQQAMNAGRKEVFSTDTPQPSDFYASELLDTNTCEECVNVDGTQYPDIDAAEADYPTGGYMDCLGGPRCRGTVIAVYSEVETGE